MPTHDTTPSSRSTLRTPMPRTRRSAVAPLLVLALPLLVACGDKKNADAATTTPPVATIGTENIVVVDTARIQSGPQLSGELSAEKSAAVRAEVPGSVIQTYVEPGQRVTAGTILARIEAGAIAAGERSASIGVAAQEAQAAQAARELERSQRLNAAGAIADRDLENARNANTLAQAQLAAARSTLASAAQALRSATVRAPFAGIVAEKQVSAGDVVLPGAALFTVVDPRSMRLDAAVPAQQLAQVKVGMPVSFTVSGYEGRTFSGRVSRVAPVADPTTRQVRILATIPNEGGTLVGGLFAEGRVSAQSRTALVVPLTAIDQRGAQPAAFRLRNGRIERVPVELGLRDDSRENIELTRGIARGDTLLIGAAQAIGEGAQVRVGRIDDATAAPTAAPKAPRTSSQEP